MCGSRGAASTAARRPALWGVSWSPAWSGLGPTCPCAARPHLPLPPPSPLHADVAAGPIKHRSSNGTSSWPRSRCRRAGRPSPAAPPSWRRAAAPRLRAPRVRAQQLALRLRHLLVVVLLLALLLQQHLPHAPHPPNRHPGQLLRPERGRALRCSRGRGRAPRGALAAVEPLTHPNSRRAAESLAGSASRRLSSSCRRSRIGFLFARISSTLALRTSSTTRRTLALPSSMNTWYDANTDRSRPLPP